MQILCYTVGELQTNCYLLIQDNSCLMIDPGDSAEFLSEEIQRKNLILKGILITHGHFDHCMAAGEIQVAFGNEVGVYIDKEDVFLLKRLTSTAEHFLSSKPVIIPPVITPIDEGEKQIDDFKFKVIETPGHTPGSVCFYFKNEQILFSGDTIFKDAIGSYEHAYSNKKQLLESVKKLKSILKNTLVYAGHGEKFIL